MVRAISVASINIVNRAEQLKSKNVKKSGTDYTYSLFCALYVIIPKLMSRLTWTGYSLLSVALPFRFFLQRNCFNFGIYRDIILI